jgi:hypothetical protein
VRGVGRACVVALLCAGCAAAGSGKAAVAPATRGPASPVIVPRVTAACALPSVARCRRIEALVRWEREQTQPLAHLGATIVDTYDHPPLTIVFLTGTLTDAVRRYVEANLPPVLHGVPIDIREGPISYAV